MPQAPIGVAQAVVELLVYLNFNSRFFIHYYTTQLTRQMSQFEAVSERMTLLLVSQKQFAQMHKKPGVQLIADQACVERVITNWFEQEIAFLEKSAQLDMSPQLLTPTSSPVVKSNPFKVMVLLSVDQIGLLLRALDSLRIIKARSMNAVFQSITPFLSTPRTEQISWDSMRSKSYATEERDKEAVVKMLESVIRWIDETDSH